MSIANDMKFALRQVAKHPGFTLVVVLTLAIGIGANAAMFSIVNGVLLRPLPYPDADRLVVVNNSYPGLGAEQTEVSIPDYLDRRAGVPAFEESALWYWTSAGVTTGSTPDHYSGVRATRTLFSTLQTYPALGRNFTVEEMQPGKDKVVILAHSLWQELFDGSRDAIGSDVRIDGTVHRVVGVMPRGFAFPDRDAEYFVPFAFTPEQMSDQERGNQFADMLARLAPGATAEQAHAQMQAIIEGLKNRMPEFREIMNQARITTIVTDLRTVRTDGAEKPLLLLQLCVGFVLLIVCANIANLFLTRVISRQRELSVRTALGAGRLRIARQLLTESLLLSLLGGIGGILLAYAGLEIFRTANMLSASAIFDIGLDPSVLFVTLSIALGAGFAFGLFPVAAAWRRSTADMLKDGGRGTSSGKGARFSRSALVVAQVTLAVALLVSAGLLMRSFATLQSVDPGFNETGVLTARISLPDSRYPEPAAVQGFQQRLDRALDGLPGRTASAMTAAVPFGHSSSSGTYSIRGMQTDSTSTLHSNRFVVSDDYFRTMQIGLLKGRSLGNPESLTAPLRDALQRLDSELPVYDIETLHARIDDSLRSERMPMLLLAVFAGIALLLAAIGLYGVLACSVAQRTGEIGVRMAVGADRERIMKLILGQGARLISMGLGLGLLLALMLGMGLRSMLFGVGAADPVVYLSAVALLALIAFSACAVPSWRATRVNPVDALRDE